MKIISLVFACIFTLPTLANEAIPARDLAPPDFIVASGPVRRLNDAKEVCTALGRRLPSPEEAIAIYRSTVNSAGKTALENYDGNVTSGSFWTNRVAGALACPVALMVQDPELNEGRSIQLMKICGIQRTKLLTVCVASTSEQSRSQP